LGLVSKSGKLKRSDINDLKTWMNDLLKKIEQDYTILTSTNHFSKAILDKVVKMAQQKNIDIEINELGAFNWKGLTWHSKSVSKKGECVFALAFDSTSKAIQFLSDYTNKKVIILLYFFLIYRYS
jgi:hypothetical protein